MASNPLLSQIADRTSAFLNTTGITQARLCRHLSISDSSLCQFLNGTKGLDPSVIIKLCQTLNLSKRDVATKFSTEHARSSKILNLQESTEGRPARMRLDNSGWYPSTDGSGGVDPYDPTGNAIDNTPDADTAGSVWDQDLIDTLREARGYHRKIVRAISDYIQKAKVNAGITVPSGVSQKFSRR